MIERVRVGATQVDSIVSVEIYYQICILLASLPLLNPPPLSHFSSFYSTLCTVFIVRRCASFTAGREVRGNLMEPVLSFRILGPRNQTLVARFSDKSL